MTRIPFDKLPTPPRTPRDTPRNSSPPPTPRARTKAKPALAKRDGTARLSMPEGFQKKPASVKAAKKLVTEKPEKAWTPGKVDKDKPSVSGLIGGFMGWLQDANGKPEQGAALLRALGQAATNQKKIDRLAGNVVSDIVANFPPEEIGAVTERLEKLQPHLMSYPQFYLACHDKLVGLENRQTALSQPSGEISYEKQCAQAMKGYFDALKNSKDETTWDKSFERLREITRQRDLLMPGDVYSWIDAELDICSSEDLIAIYKGAEHLRDMNIEGDLASHMSDFLLKELIPHYDTEQPVPFDKEPVPLDKEPIPLIATEGTGATTSTRPKQGKHKLLDPASLPKLKLPTLPTPKLHKPDLSGLKLGSLPTPKRPKFKSPLGSPRSPFTSPLGSPRSPFSSETRYSKAPSIEESEPPPELSLVFNRPRWNVQGEAATAEFISQLIEGDPKSMKKSYYDGLYSVAKIVTDVTKIGDLDEFDSWIDKALAGKSNKELDKIAAAVFGADFGAKGELFKNFKHRLYLRLLDRPVPPGRVRTDLALAENYIFSVMKGEPTAGSALLFDGLRDASNADRILVDKKFEALCAPTLTKLTSEQLLQFGQCIPQGSGIYSESLLLNAFQAALDKLPKPERNAILKKMGW